MMRKLILLYVLSMTLTLSLKAQEFTYTIKTDTIAYSIGANIGVTHEWSYPEGKNFEAPVLPPNIGKLEKVEEGETEKSTSDGKSVFTQKGTYTCFDTGYYQIKGLAWKAGEDSVFSNALIFKIELVEVDTAKDIKDIEPPLKIPYTLKEVLPFIGVGAGVLVLITLIVLLVVKTRNKKEEVKIPQRPAYIVAYEKLEVLKSKRLWEQGMYKDYHFSISVIVREYIQDKYDVTTQELTTDELMSLCGILKIPQDLTEDLRKTLSLGDLAKFAKAVPSPQQNEDAWTVVHDFVTKTHLTQPKEDDKHAS